MEPDAIKELIYGGTKELVQNRRYFYHSAIGTEYCHFTPEGEKALMEFIKQMAVNIHKAEDVMLDKRAKALVLKGLKGETV